MKQSYAPGGLFGGVHEPGQKSRPREKAKTPCRYSACERSMSTGNPDFSAQEFVEKMELGLFDGKLNQELEKLSREQLHEVAQILNHRPTRETPPSGTDI
jgi:hypothetical protein